MRIRFHPSAIVDLEQSIEYYKNIDENIVINFTNSLEICLKNIQEFPEIYPFETKKAQKVALHNFPYSVIYQNCNTFIFIFAVFHHKRNPHSLNNRIR